MSTRISGIYAIWRSGAEQCYVGSSADIGRRWREHLSTLRRNKHHSPRLQHAWNKYGEEAFAFAVIEECDVERLLEREQYFVDALAPAFNMSLVADCPWRGQSPSAETRAKMAAAKLGKKQDAQHVANRVNGRKGYRHSEETRRRMADAWSSERRAAATEQLRIYNLDRTITSETRAKQSVAQKARFAREREQRAA